MKLKMFYNLALYNKILEYHPFSHCVSRFFWGGKKMDPQKNIPQTHVQFSSSGLEGEHPSYLSMKGNVALSPPLAKIFTKIALSEKVGTVSS